MTAVETSEIVEIEQAVLAACLAGAEAVAGYRAAGCGGELFTVPLHQAVWWCVDELADEGQPVTAVRVTQRLVATGRAHYDQLKNGLRLHELVERSGPISVDYALGRLRAESQRRALVAATRSIATRAETEQAVADWPQVGEELAGQAAEQLDAIARSAATSVTEVVEAADPAQVSALLEQWGSPRSSSWATGLADLDRHLMLDPGDLVTVGAYSGVGKTMLAGTMARHSLLELGLPVLVISCEMSADELRTRDLAALSGVGLRTAHGKEPLQAGDRERLGRAAERYARAHEVGYAIEYAPNATFQQIKSRALAFRRRHGSLGVLVVDYLQRMSTQGMPGDRHDLRLGEFSGRLKQLAVEMDCVVLTVSQLTKPQQAPGQLPPAPNRNMLRDSAFLLNDSDAVFLLHEPAPQGHPEAPMDRLGELDVIIAKNRNGVETIVPVSDQRHCARITSLAK